LKIELHVQVAIVEILHFSAVLLLIQVFHRVPSAKEHWSSKWGFYGGNSGWRDCYRHRL